MKEVKFCENCGRVLQNEVCPVHKTFTKRPVPRQKIGKYSGKSSNKEYGVNWSERVGER